MHRLEDCLNMSVINGHFMSVNMADILSQCTCIGV